jgi:hypothetical protein
MGDFFGSGSLLWRIYIARQVSNPIQHAQAQIFFCGAVICCQCG